MTTYLSVQNPTKIIREGKRESVSFLLEFLETLRDDGTKKYPILIDFCGGRMSLNWYSHLCYFMPMGQHFNFESSPPHAHPPPSSIQPIGYASVVV